MRRKVEILKYKNTESNLTKKMSYSKLAKGVTPFRKKSYASQSFDGTNNNVIGLKEVKFKDKYIVIMECNKLKNIPFTRSAQCGVPKSASENNILYLDRSIPLTENNDKPRKYTYKGGNSKIRSLNCVEN